MLHALMDLWNDDIDQRLGVDVCLTSIYKASVFAPLNLLLECHDVWPMQDGNG